MQFDCDDTGPMGDARRLTIRVADGRIEVLDRNTGTVTLSRPLYGYERHMANEIERLQQLVADHEDVHSDQKRLVRELDVLLNGEDGAAPQASLCDIVGDLKSPRRKSLTQI